MLASAVLAAAVAYLTGKRQPFNSFQYLVTRPVLPYRSFVNRQLMTGGIPHALKLYNRAAENESGFESRFGR